MTDGHCSGNSGVALSESVEVGWGKRVQLSLGVTQKGSSNHVPAQRGNLLSGDFKQEVTLSNQREFQTALPPATGQLSPPLATATRTNTNTECLDNRDREPQCKAIARVHSVGEAGKRLGDMHGHAELAPKDQAVVGRSLVVPRGARLSGAEHGCVEVVPVSCSFCATVRGKCKWVLEITAEPLELVGDEYT